MRSPDVRGQAVGNPPDEEGRVAKPVARLDRLLHRGEVSGAHDPLDERQDNGLLVLEVGAEHLPEARQPDLQSVVVVLARVLDHGVEGAGEGCQRRVDLGVLGAHRLHLRTVGRGATPGDRGVQDRPVVLVLRMVVLVQDVGEPRPAPAERRPRVDLTEGGQGDARGEASEVATEAMVHDVHPGVVVRAVRDVGLPGEVDLAHRCAP